MTSSADILSSKRCRLHLKPCQRRPRHDKRVEGCGKAAQIMTADGCRPPCSSADGNHMGHPCGCVAGYAVKWVGQWYHKMGWGS
eukprot:752393-Hanusia_phi.AAC.4